MRILFLLAALVVLIAPVSAFCDSSSRTMEVDGQERSYLLHVPPATRKLLVVLHGGGQTASRIRRVTGILEPALRRGYAVVFPAAIGRHWNDGRMDKNIHTWDREPQDVEFLSRLIDKLQHELKIPADRVYVTGPSNGGMMTFRLGCERSEQLAAIAPVIAALPEKLSDSCKPKKALPLLMLNGRDDPMVPYEGGHLTVLGRDRGDVLSVESTFERWARGNGCAGPPVRESLPKRLEDDPASVVRSQYSDCSRAPAVLYTINKAGHRWFGNEPSRRPWFAERHAGPNTGELDANRTILDFFDRN